MVIISESCEDCAIEADNALAAELATDAPATGRADPAPPDAKYAPPTPTPTPVMIALAIERPAPGPSKSVISSTLEVMFSCGKSIELGVVLGVSVCSHHHLDEFRIGNSAISSSRSSPGSPYRIGLEFSSSLASSELVEGWT